MALFILPLAALLRVFRPLFPADGVLLSALRPVLLIFRRYLLVPAIYLMVGPNARERKLLYSIKMTDNHAPVCTTVERRKSWKYHLVIRGGGVPMPCIDIMPPCF